MADGFRELDEITAVAAPEDVIDMMEVPEVFDLEGELMSNPGTPFDRLLDARGLSRDDAVAVLVDDDGGVLEVVPDLIKFGFNVRVITAVNGKRGLALLEERLGNVCFVLSDTEMPVMGGPEMLRAAKNRGLLHRLPVVIATANMAGNAGVIADAINSGAARESIAKPFMPYELIDAVNAACLQILDEMEEEAMPGVDEHEPKYLQGLRDTAENLSEFEFVL